MSWGIAETASEIEKIKSESADYLNGLYSCGVIDWNVYNYAFDFYEVLLMKAYEQGRKDAQPEPPEDICGECDAWNKYKSEHKTGRWIPVSERLPEYGKPVLWSNECGSVFTSAITVMNDRSWAIGKRHRLTEVTAWMSLPDPFREEGDE